MRITMGADHGTVASIELGPAAEPTNPAVDVGYFDDGELAGYGGNLYLFADGVEIGSLFFHTVDGRLRVALGQFDPQGGWVERNPVGVVTDLPGGAEMLAGLAPVGD